MRPPLLESASTARGRVPAVLPVMPIPFQESPTIPNISVSTSAETFVPGPQDAPLRPQRRRRFVNRLDPWNKEESPGASDPGDHGVSPASSHSAFVADSPPTESDTVTARGPVPDPVRMIAPSELAKQT
jgi:hypothetical protein